MMLCRHININKLSVLTGNGETMSEVEIKKLKNKIKNLEKSNKNWRRKCKRLRNKNKGITKIYQIHEYGGQWEDAYDYIVSSYFSEDKAIAEKERLEMEEEERRKCESCPLYFCEDECDGDCEECNKHNVEKAKAYCDKYEPFDKAKHDPEEYDESDGCVNRYLHYENSYYKIEEVEVIG